MTKEILNSSSHPEEKLTLPTLKVYIATVKSYLAFFWSSFWIYYCITHQLWNIKSYTQDINIKLCDKGKNNSARKPRLLALADGVLGPLFVMNVFKEGFMYMCVWYLSPKKTCQFGNHTDMELIKGTTLSFKRYLRNFTWFRPTLHPAYTTSGLHYIRPTTAY